MTGSDLIVAAPWMIVGASLSAVYVRLLPSRRVADPAGGDHRTVASRKHSDCFAAQSRPADSWRTSKMHWIGWLQPVLATASSRDLTSGDPLSRDAAAAADEVAERAEAAVSEAKAEATAARGQLWQDAGRGHFSLN